MKKLLGVVLLASLLVPWPLILAEPIRPLLQGVLPPDEIELAAPRLAALIAYPTIGLVALLTLGALALRERNHARARGEGTVTPGHGSLAPPTEAERRERERRRKKSQEEGQLLLTLSLLADEGKKKR